MSERSASLAAGVLLGVLLGVPPVATRAHADELPAYHLQASLQLKPAHVNGTVDVSFVNRSTRTLTEAVVFLFPNRFAEPDAGINDFNRPFVYPEKTSIRARWTLLEARDAGAADVDRAAPRRGGSRRLCRAGSDRAACPRRHARADAALPYGRAVSLRLLRSLRGPADARRWLVPVSGQPR